MSQTLLECCQNDELDYLLERLADFKGMQPGWLDGDGESLDSQGLDWLSDNFQRYFSTDFPLPAVFPTEEGNVSAQWREEDITLRTVFFLKERKAKLTVFDKVSKKSIREEYDLHRSIGWTTLLSKLREFCL